ncbi:diguanylate cyclase [Neorhizobium sp. NCHU2750]|uniref:GGDEF domain-containing response regulator n=1 Tax=Neorhizobium sp. NCHU2750 TaxID=1825976 RepID=UPI000E70F274|nr:diguanylate cyclase [Neorhizobium sp. NCHU2750]
MTIGRENLFADAGVKLKRDEKILIVEDSVALSTLLTNRLEEETGATVIRCGSLKEARARIAEEHFILALTGLNLPDAPDGEILDLLSGSSIPTIVFTATFDAETRARCNAKKIVDYIVKHGSQTIDMVIQTVNRILTNGAHKILVVDDARSARSELVGILMRQNFQVLEASSGREALEILAADSTIELIITDHHMADMEGYELTRRIRQTRNSEQMRIIGISSSSDRLLSASFLKAGASDFIYRPFVDEELKCRIDNNIETLTQLRHLRRLAEQDYLTGLANRRHFFAHMRKLEKTGLHGSIALLDIDFFKTVNDTYGHDTGDIVLRAVSDVMSAMCAPAGHMPARLGGEEFAIFLSGLDAFQAHSFCEQLRKAVEETSLAIGGQSISVTISAGVVEFEPDDTFDNHLSAADQLLYMAKSNGRNRVYSTLTIPEAMMSGSSSAAGN